MAKKNTFDWGKASMIAGAGVFFYLAFRKPAQTAEYIPSKVPDFAFNPSLDDPKHWAYQLRPGKPNPSYDMSNYSKDMFEIGEALKTGLYLNRDKLLKGYQYCDVYGPYNDLQSPYGPRAGFVLEFFAPISKEEFYDAAPAGTVNLPPSYASDFKAFGKRLFIPVWLPQPQDEKFENIALSVFGPLAASFPGITLLVDGEIYGNKNTRTAYDPESWMVRNFLAHTDPSNLIKCTQDGYSPGELLAGKEPDEIMDLRTYVENRDARDDL